MRHTDKPSQYDWSLLFLGILVVITIAVVSWKTISLRDRVNSLQDQITTLQQQEEWHAAVISSLDVDLARTSCIARYGELPQSKLNECIDDSRTTYRIMLSH